MGCPETSVRNYHKALCNSPEEHSSRLLRGGSFTFFLLTFYHQNLQTNCAILPSIPAVCITITLVFLKLTYLKKNITEEKLELWYYLSCITKLFFCIVNRKYLREYHKHTEALLDLLCFHTLISLKSAVKCVALTVCIRYITGSSFWSVSRYSPRITKILTVPSAAAVSQTLYISPN